MSLTDILKHPMAAAAGAGLGLVVALTPVKATMQDNKPKVEYVQAQAEERAYYPGNTNLEKLLPANYSVRKTVDVDKNNVRFEKNDREYVQIVKDDEGNPIMRVELEYIGKEPPTEIAEKYPVNKRFWKRGDIDFYNLIFENVGTKPIGFDEIQYRMERTVNKGPSNRNGVELQRTLAKQWGSPDILPGDIKKSLAYVSSEKYVDAQIRNYIFSSGITCKAEIIIPYRR